MTQQAKITQDDTTRETVRKAAAALEMNIQFFRHHMEQLTSFCGMTEEEELLLEHTMFNLLAEVSYLERLFRENV